MSAPLRILMGVVLLGLALGVGYYLVTAPKEAPTSLAVKGFGPPPDGGFDTKLLTTSDQCAACHPAIYAEWKSSHHEFAWLNPEPRRKGLSDNFKNKDCIPCHAPRPMLDVGFGARALERESRRDDGVNCFTCHGYRNAILTPNALTSAASEAPCQPVTWKPLAEMTLCAPCHDQHKVHQNWLQSRFAVKGEAYQDCNDCHMPVMPGPPTVGSERSTHRSHVFGGGHDPSILRTAAILRATLLEPGETVGAAIARFSTRTWRGKGSDQKAGAAARILILQVENSGTGHNFPDDERHRAGDVVVRFFPEEQPGGERLRLTRFRNPYRHEFQKNPFEGRAAEVLSNSLTWDGHPLTLSQLRLAPEHRPRRKVYYPDSTQLLSGESRFIWFELPFSGPGRVELKLLYKLNPHLLDDDAVLVSETKVYLDG
ncbi:MAG: multiheme c-type cytochrome [Planctomycetota bacterium]